MFFCEIDIGISDSEKRGVYYEKNNFLESYARHSWVSVDI
jgi:hypothetical protein